MHSQPLDCGYMYLHEAEARNKLFTHKLITKSHSRPTAFCGSHIYKLHSLLLNTLYSSYYTHPKDIDGFFFQLQSLRENAIFIVIYNSIQYLLNAGKNRFIIMILHLLVLRVVEVALDIRIPNQLISCSWCLVLRSRTQELFKIPLKRNLKSAFFVLVGPSSRCGVSSSLSQATEIQIPNPQRHPTYLPISLKPLKVKPSSV